MVRFAAFVLLWAVLAIPATLRGEQSEQSATRRGNGEVLLPALGFHGMASEKLAQAAAKDRWKKFGLPEAGHQASPSGQQRTSRSLAAGLAGVGLMVVGAAAAATASQSAEVSGGGVTIKAKATNNGQRIGGITLIGAGGVLAWWGFSQR